MSLLKTKKVILILFVFLSVVKSQAQLQSALPLNAYGVWDRSAVSLTDNSHIDLFKGLQLGYKWSQIEPVNNEFDWTQFDKEIQFAYDNNLYAYISIGPGPDCPDWVYNTVPKLLTDNTDHDWEGEFPYYYHQDYIAHYYDMVSNLAAHIASLDAELRERIAFYHVKTGCTGDECPQKGNYLPESPYKLYISDAEWQNFRIDAFAHHKKELLDGLDIPLLFNNIDSEVSWQLAAWTWLSENIGTGFGLKGSAYVRGHHLTGEEYFKNQWYDNLVNSSTLALFSRAEMDQTHTRPLYLINKPLGFYWGVLSGLNTGLSVFDITKSAVDALPVYPDIIPSLEFFNRFAPEIYPATTKGAYSIFHEGLNSTDLIKFPEGVYGTAAKTNEQRYINICAAYAYRGAQMDDLYAATMGQVYQRRSQTGYNDAGWDIPGGNYERWIEQIDPDGTSIGLFRLNANAQGLLDENNSIYDRFARSFENSSEKNTMYFKFHEDVFSETAGQPDVITFELTWLDRNANSTWELQYDAGAGNIKTAYAATGIGDNKWKTITIALSDAMMNNNCPNGADFMLVNTDDIDDIFHGFEVLISRKNNDDANTNTKLSDLKVNGVTVSRFSPNTKVYDIELPAGTIDVPTITAIVNESGATINISPTENLPGTTTVTVTAKDGITTDTYTINFSVIQINTDDYIAILSPVENQVFALGEPVIVTAEGFDADGIEKFRFRTDGGTYYNVEASSVTSFTGSYTFTDLSEGTHVIEVQMKDDQEPTAGRVLSEPVTITVIDSSSQSNDATLSNLQVNGTTITGFSTSKDIYDIELPEGTTDVPAVTATSTDINADVQVTNAEGLPGTALVLVTAEDGVTTKTYTVNFAVAPSTNATLSDLSINDTTITDFSASKEVYDIELPFGTTDIPNVSATATDINATVSVNNSPTLPGTASILVTAENSVTTKTYTINFTVASPSVSIDNLNVSDKGFVKVYPNPAKEFLNIDFATTGKRKIELLNSVGQGVYRVQTNTTSVVIDIKTLNIKGLVTLQIKTDNSVTNHKVIVR